AFRTKQAIIDKVFSAPALYGGLVAGNPGVAAILGRYERNLSLVKELVLSGDAAGLAALMNQS
ncbi:MAG: hypothetical protein ACD_75C02278G0001, partial [uncultured bacterium]